ncbi:hypothetical protein BMS3Bbin14_01321 [bacterium BMS3Bbin14]|nr:hypothetical protein BMS3Bbin14_01321 [bacterium BMS3Bbin14]
MKFFAHCKTRFHHFFMNDRVYCGKNPEIHVYPCGSPPPGMDGDEVLAKTKSTITPKEK